MLLSIVALQLTVSNLLPYPFDKVNIVFAILIIYLLFKGSGAVVWFSAAFHLLIELYSTTPFGVVLFAGTFGILIVFWVARILFTNASIQVAAGLLVLGLLFYRILYILFLTINTLIFHTIDLKFGFFTRLFAWELSSTLVFTLVLYAMVIVLSKLRLV